MQKNLFIANVEHLKISSDLGHGEKLTDKVLITNDQLFIENLLTPLFYKLAGDLEAHYLKTAGAVAYSIEENQPFPDNEAANSFLLKRLGEVRVFLQMLWLVKDNSVNVDLGYLEHPYKSTKTIRTNITRNSFSRVFSTAHGEVLTIEFTHEELRRARHLLRDFEWQS